MSKPSFHSLRAKAVLREFLRKERPPPSTVPGPTIPEPPSESIPHGIRLRLPEPGPVGIIGAGVAGIRAAMLLSNAKIPFEIIEASPRVGGRLLTHRFGDKPYDYFDVGAMRFPEITPMKSTFDLFEELGWIPGVSGPLIPYYLSSDNTIQVFNDIRVQVEQPQDVDIFQVGEAYGGTVPDDYAKAGSSKWLDEAFLLIVDELAKATTEEEILEILKPIDLFVSSILHARRKNPRLYYRSAGVPKSRYYLVGNYGYRA